MKRQAAIIGGGVIGGGWAARFLLMGWDVNLFDPAPDAKRKTNEVLANARRSLPALYEHKLPVEGNLNHVETIKDAVQNVDWIQESVPERLDLKRQILAEIQNHCTANVIVASSTSGFKPSELQENSVNPEQIIVSHPFNPVYLCPLAELVGSVKTIKKAQSLMSEIGMYPLHVRKEIDAHIADRLLEAVWREGLWLISDGIATTKEIDDAIVYGFGLRWAQMGLFETYRVAGGEAGMAHFMAQFGPALKWPWTKLMDVPELTDELIQNIADQSDVQSGHHSIRELERIRDDNLVGILRSLKVRNWAAGALLNNQDNIISGSSDIDPAKPLQTVNRVIPIDWTDYNGHMNESRYGQIFSDAADKVMEMIGADAVYIAGGNSYFTAETKIRYLDETHAGDGVFVTSQIIIGEGKKLKLYHQMFHDDARLLATAEQFLLHVNLETRASCPPIGRVAEKLFIFAAAQSKLTNPLES